MLYSRSELFKLQHHPKLIKYHKPLVVDIEATCSNRFAEIVDLALINYEDQKILFNSKIRPRTRVDRWSYKVHGISDKELKNYPYFSSYSKMLYEILNGRTVISYGGKSDVKFMQNAFRSILSEIPTMGWMCLAMITKEHFNLTTTPSLKSACKLVGIEPEPEPHSALEGAKTCYNLIKELEK